MIRFSLTALCCAVLASPVWCGETKPESKKGLQIQMFDDALALGVRHAAYNVNLVQLTGIIERDRERDAMPVEIDGRKYVFNKRYIIETLDKKIMPLMDQGVTMYLIILACNLPHSDTARSLMHTKYVNQPQCKVAGFNITDPAAAQAYRDCITFLAKRYLTPKAKLHLIIGNEVNSHWYWYNMGPSPLDAVINEYEQSVRLSHEALTAVSPGSRVYISLDHHWQSSVSPDASKAVGARVFLDEFAKRARAKGDFGWHLAFHPYPENLFEPRSWNDKHATLNPDTPKVTFKNLEFLTEYMKRPELQYNNAPRRIILSEQGFHTTKAADGEAHQAAAFAYAYKKVERLDGIDAFILHRHVDHKQEGGLNLGLWTSDLANRPVRRKMIYDVFRLADTPQWRDAFEFALPIIGIKDWKEIDEGFEHKTAASRE